MNNRTKKLIERVRKMIYTDYINELENNKNSEKLLDFVVHRMKIKEDNKVFHEEVRRYRDIFDLIDKILSKEDDKNVNNQRADKTR